MTSFDVLLYIFWSDSKMIPLWLESPYKENVLPEPLCPYVIMDILQP